MIEQKKRLEKIRLLEERPELIEYEMALCAVDANYFVDSWANTYDPRTNLKHIPFVQYDFQKKATSWISERFKNKENGIIEKSRDLGITWLVCSWVVHQWLFNPGFKALLGSRKQELVDNGSIDSIFGKIRYLVYRLPEFLKPKLIGSKPKGRKKSADDRFMALTNPENGNEIVGESANPGFGRGGRSSFVFLDEFAHVQHSDAVWASISDNADCILAGSTPLGKGNEFARLRHETKIPVLTLHWSQHPLKTQEWYERKKAEMQPWQVAQELDLSYEKSQVGKVYGRFDRKWHVAQEVIQPKHDAEHFVSWDFGIADPMALIFGQVVNGSVVEIYHYVELAGWDIDFFAPISLGRKPLEYLLADLDTKRMIDATISKITGFRTWQHYGDHAGTAKTANAKRSCRQALKDHGINLTSSGKQDFAWRIECLDGLLKLRQNESRKEWYSIFSISPQLTRLIDCMNNYVWDGEDLNKEGIKPKHNWASHGVSALEFFAINRFPIRQTTGFREAKIR